MPITHVEHSIQTFSDHPDPLVRQVVSLLSDVYTQLENIRSDFRSIDRKNVKLRKKVRNQNKRAEAGDRAQERFNTIRDQLNQSRNRCSVLSSDNKAASKTISRTLHRLKLDCGDGKLPELADAHASFALSAAEELKDLNKDHENLKTKVEKKDQKICELSLKNAELSHALDDLKCLLAESERKIERLEKGNSTTTNFPTPFDVCGKSKSPQPEMRSTDKETDQKTAGDTAGMQTPEESVLEQQKNIHRTPISSRKKTGSPRGGRPGDNTDTRKGLVEHPDEIVIRRVTKVPSGAVQSIDEEGNTYYAVQTSGIEVKNTITETRFYIDPEGEKLPDDVMDAFKINHLIYAPSLKGLCLFLLFYCRVPYAKIVETISSLTHSKAAISEGTIAKWASSLTKNSRPLTDEALDRILKEEVLYADETGFKVSGKTYWMHVLASATEAFYVVTEKRGDKENAPVGILQKAGYTGCLVTDHFASYQVLKEITHAECNVHIERYLRNGLQFDHCEACGKMLDLYSEMRALKKKQVEAGQTGLDTATLEEVKRRFLEICRQGMETWEDLLAKINEPEKLKQYTPPYYTTFKRMAAKPDDYLRWLMDYKIPFGNNRAEQCIQKPKAKMRSARQCVTKNGSDQIAAAMTVMETARAHEQNILDLFCGLLS